MTKIKKKKKIVTIITLICISAVAILCGYLCGSMIKTKYFAASNFSNVDIATLRDNIDSISYADKSPEEFNGAIVFQIAEKIQRESTHYEIIGNGTIDTSLGVTQTSATVDKRDGDDLYLAFTTYSSIVKVSRQCNYQLGGNIRMYEGTPNDSTTTNVNWSQKYDEFTWEGYYETFGKYANNNCCYIVSTKTTTTCSNVEKDGNLYKCSIELNPSLACISYAKQIGANMGIDPQTVRFNKIAFTFWIDENWHFIKQEKFESYTVQYMGVNLTLNATIETNFDIK